MYPECDASTVPRNETIVVFGSNRNIATPYGVDTGRAVQVDPGFSQLTHTLAFSSFDQLLSNFAFNFNLRYYTPGWTCATPFSGRRTRTTRAPSSISTATLGRARHILFFILLDPRIIL